MSRSGAIVRLNGGGPNMLVLRVEGDDAACVWEQDGGVVRKSFNVTTIVEVLPPSGINRGRRAGRLGRGG